MGIPIQTPMGATGGAGIFTAIDNSIELGAIGTELGVIAAALTTMIATNQVQWGPAALTVPGSPAAALANIATQLSILNDNLVEIKNKNVALQGSLSELSNSLKAQTHATHALQTLQAMAVSDQITNNAFVKAETVAALQRNGIEPQPAPDVKQLLKDNIKGAVEFSTSANFTAGLLSISSSALTMLTNYIKTSSLYTWAQASLDKLWASLGLNKLTERLTNPEQYLKEKAAEAEKIKARTGVWTPGTYI